MSQIIFASTAQLAAAIRTRDISAVEVLDAHLAQIASRNPALNAIITLDVERARTRAREADAALSRGEIWGPLHGVPFTLKDALATAGMRTTTGSPMLDHVPQDDSAVSARLKRAGGILIGKTNVAEMLGDPGQSNNPLFGRTNNPWDTTRTAGGSSGGAAAAVAAGMTPFDIGTDLSGSIRIPAHFCGVFGLKPTEHRVSLAGLIPGLPPPRSVRLMSCIGPLARSVDDLALLYTIIAGPDGYDTDVPPVPLGAPPARDLKTVRVAIAPTFPGLPVAAEIGAAFESLASKLRSSGVTVTPASLPELDFTQELMRAGDLIGMMVGAFQPENDGPPTTLAQYLTALDQRDQSLCAWERFFEAWDVLLCPASMVSAFPHCEPGSPLLVDGQPQVYWQVSAHTVLFNYTGHPAVVLPAAQGRDGMPIGVQLVGKRWEEARLLEFARALAALTGGFRRPPGY
jgi:amidase